MEGNFFRFIGIDHESFVEAVKTAKGDWEILLWVNNNATLPRTPLEVSQWADWTASITLNNVEDREWFTEQIARINAEREDIVTLFDYFDLDDFASFGGVA